MLVDEQDTYIEMFRTDYILCKYENPENLAAPFVTIEQKVLLNITY